MTQDDIQMSPEDIQTNTELFGSLAKYADHKIGDQIRFNLRGQEVAGEIVWITEAGPLPASGKHAPVCYVCGVDGELSFALVYPGEVLEDHK